MPASSNALQILFSEENSSITETKFCCLMFWFKLGFLMICLMNFPESFLPKAFNLNKRTVCLSYFGTRLVKVRSTSYLNNSFISASVYNPKVLSKKKKNEELFFIMQNNT